MSIPKRAMITCPSCNKKYEATVFESLNTDFNPNIIKDVISGDRFIAKCPRCGFAAHLEYDLLYHDLKHGAMVWVIHDNNPEYAKKVTEVRSAPMLPYNVTRIVSDMDALREKAACLESGKDDRLVELCKVFLASQICAQEPNFKLKSSFYTYQNGKDIVYFYDHSGREIWCYLDDKAYSIIEDSFEPSLLQTKSASFQIIDYNWAAKQFNSLPDGGEEEKILDVRPAKSDSSASDGDVAEACPSKKALFCRKCGAKLLLDSLFCSYCGTEVAY